MRVTRVGVLVSLGLLLSASNWLLLSRPSKVPVRQQWIGAWRLVSDEETVNGTLTKLDQTGILTYTSDGHMSVQIMDRDPNAMQSGSPCSTEPKDTKDTSAPSTSRKPLTLLHITSKVLLCAHLSAKTLRESTRFRVSSSS
jgi:hypothetical protein